MPTHSVPRRTRFFDHRIPSLDAGKYQITVTEEIEELSTGSDIPGARQPFDVRALRFGVSENDVHACYPVPGTVGEYQELLPHITLDSPGLPWARKLKQEKEEIDRGVPWMALLVFREGELPNDEDALGLVEPCTVTQLLDGDLGGTPPGIPRDSLFADEHDLVCNTVLVPADLLRAVLPRPAEAALLAHAREGGPPDATHTRSEDDPPDEDELKTVVVANRFPDAAGGNHAVHLISLEGLESLLTGDSGDSVSGNVRVVSLWSWSFESLYRTTRGFGDVVQYLATEGREDARPDLLLRLRTTPPGSPTAPQQEALARLARGATALPQRLESGEASYAFYRGPFTAEPAQPLPAELPPRLDSGNAALIYLAKYGIFDAGYAAAFSLGRNLALADPEFRSRLLAYRSAARSATRRLAGHPRLAGRSIEDAGLLRGGLARRSFDRLHPADGGARFTRAVAAVGPALLAGGRRARTRALATPRPGAADLRANLAEPAARTLLRGAVRTELDPVVAWLDRLRRLEMVPFDHLVPDPRMLPEESLRFGYVDAGWVRAAVDGALSVGVGHTLDADLNELARDGVEPPASVVLIRSELVPNWPKTIYTAHRDDAPVEPVRIARFADDVLVLFFDTVLDTFTIAEPPQGLHFGVSSLGQLMLRNLDPDADPVGEPIRAFPEETHAFGRFLRNASDAELGADVLNVADGPGALHPAVSQALAEGGGHDGELTPAKFALQLINTPELQSFERP
ncbi:hypothetical protein [Marinactinospora rubrisoli]|uniref:Uncharacterized protein n=1 Tax=Marinactinospora rubrisoli TaxID=2715399 RepID=A0ABW2KJ44_9ACTN